MKIYQPKGSMCAVCKYKGGDCSGLDFESMPPMGQYSLENDSDVYKVVKCAKFDKDTRDD